MSFFDSIIKINRKKDMSIVGLTDEFFCVYLNNLYKESNENILVVVNSLYEANKLYSSLINYTSNTNLFPMDDFLTSEALSVSPELMMSRLETIEEINKGKPRIIITDLMGYLRFLPSKKRYNESLLTLKVDEEISQQEIIEQLMKLGYEKETLVTNTKEYGIRGFILDIFPLGYDNPVRIEFFGDEIESMRLFDPKTQKSIKEITQVQIDPVWEFIVDELPSEEYEYKQKYLPKYSKKVESIYDYLNKPITIFKDDKQLKASQLHLEEEMLEYRHTKDQNFKGRYCFSLEDIKTNEVIYYHSIDDALDIHSDKKEVFHISTINNFHEDKDAINRYLREKQEQKKTIIIALKKYQIRSLLKNINMKVIETTEDKIYLGEINIIEKELNEGFIYEDIIVLTQNELFLLKQKEKTYKTKFKYGTSISSLNKLEIGDYIVHKTHGIGIYNGIKVLNQNGLNKDYIELLYKGKDKLYIPVEKIDTISKYSAKEGAAPTIHKLGGTEWSKTKARVKGKVKDMAEKLLKLYAERDSKKGFAFSKDSDLMNNFQEDFSYELTTDQKTAIFQIKEDMESIKPMDRLLCGDVGFGKTEVAFVAAFKAILDSKQVLFLCPTTILSNQHYENAIERFKNFPISIGLLNRFTPPKEVKRIIEGLKNKTIDLVFGTHRLLSGDVMPSDLGLLVVDEEQRFGVTHKERIKEFKVNVDVLTLTATPIPRTLQMSMTGLRSLSIIETPPINRYPVQTYVIEENKPVMKDAIYKELSRKGQIFILYNRVESIEKKMLEIAKLAPDAKVDFAHGQMSKNELEDKIIKFTNHEFDILVCTTIIETGIDMPNVNTLIILEADRFGLSQLYQIRGRVGRCDKFAYAYLMYKPNKVLTETAVKRLNVIKEFTQLGSGFSIATRDLSIRGAGDVLGSEQAGFIDSVGIDLYLKMLDDEIKIQQGINVEEDDEESNTPLISVATHIEDKYVSEDDLKIEIHRKINEIDSKEKLEEIKEELEDRFGKITEEMYIYMHEEWFEKLVKKIPVKQVRETKNFVEMTFSREIVERINIDELFVESFNISPMFRFMSRGSNLMIILDTVKLENNKVFYLVELLDKIENIRKATNSDEKKD